MKFRFFKKESYKKYDPYEWRVIFALFPHHVGDGDWVWLEKCETRISPYSPLGITPEYRKLDNET